MQLSTTPSQVLDQRPTCCVLLGNLVHILTGNVTSCCKKRRPRNSSYSDRDDSSRETVASEQLQRMQRLHDVIRGGRDWNIASADPCQCCVDANDVRSLPCVHVDSQESIAKTFCESCHTNVCSKCTGLGKVRLCCECRDGEGMKNCKKMKHHTPRGSKRKRDDSDTEYHMSNRKESSQEQTTTRSHPTPSSPASLDQNFHKRLACANTPPRARAR